MIFFKILKLLDDGDCAIANACQSQCDVSFVAPKLMYTIYSRTPDQDFRYFNPFEIILSHIHVPMHTGSSGPYVSSMSAKSVLHRYPCETSVNNVR